MLHEYGYGVQKSYLSIARDSGGAEEERDRDSGASRFAVAAAIVDDIQKTVKPLFLDCLGHTEGGWKVISILPPLSSLCSSIS